MLLYYYILYYLLYIYYYILLLYYYIIYLFIFFLSSSSVLFSFPFPHPSIIQSIRVGTWICLLIFQTHRTIRPRTNYRSGWLRCDVFKCIGLGFGVLGSDRCLTCGGFCYYILLLLYYYYILYSSLLLFLPHSSSLPFLSPIGPFSLFLFSPPLSHLPLLFFYSLPNILFLFSSHSKYTCRHLDPLIYILLICLFLIPII